MLLTSFVNLLTEFIDSSFEFEIFSKDSDIFVRIFLIAISTSDINLAC
jgi:hypothetical protein